MNTSSLSWLFFTQLVYLVASWIFYAIDRNWGRGLYRWWYNLTHEDVLTKETIRGFVCGRTARAQVRMAFVLSIVTTLLMTIFVQKGAVIWFGTWVLGFFTTIVGFVLGPMIAKLWAKRETVYTAIDKIEAGEVPEEVEKVKKSLLARLSGWWPKRSRPPEAPAAPVNPVAHSVEEPETDATVVEASVSTPPKPKTDFGGMTAEEMINKFTRGG